jgi:diaminohydroxyphosphoribosylaminopyrimidine deaminase/5-amino-6-(5-phosphoribosylamino)uracil reductase
VTRAGIRRAVIAMPDPNPLVRGGGLRHLRESGVETIVGVEEAAAARQNAVFLTNIRRGRPHVTLKAAVSLDGRLGAPGVPTRLTGPAADRRVQRQRAEVDAIAVGSGTVLVDDPHLTARGAYRERPLTRVLFDRRLRTPPSARVLSTVAAGPVIIVSSASTVAASARAAGELEAAGARILVPAGDGLPAALRALMDAGVASLVLEGGGTLHRAALDAGVVDAVHVYITPRPLGPGGVAWIGEGRLAWEWLRDRHAAWLGDDLFVEGVVETDVHGAG